MTEFSFPHHSDSNDSADQHKYVNIVKVMPHCISIDRKT